MHVSLASAQFTLFIIHQIEADLCQKRSIIKMLKTSVPTKASHVWGSKYAEDGFAVTEK